MSEYQVMPELTIEEYAELKADIAMRGVMVPIEYDEAGKPTYAQKLNMACWQLTQEQKRGSIRERLKATPEQSDRQIAQALGVSHPTVSAQRKELEENGDVERFTTSTDILGREQPRTHKPLAISQKRQAPDIDISQHGEAEDFRPCGTDPAEEIADIIIQAIAHNNGTSTDA